MKAYWRVDVQVHIYLTSKVVGGKSSASGPGRFTHREGTAGTHWIEGWVDPRAVLDDVGKRKLTLSGLEFRLLSRAASSQSLY
jgi:hypothetical protein